MSAGWCTLPLYELNGSLTEAKSHELKIHGGTPYDRDVPISEMVREKRPSLWQRFRNAIHEPRLVVKVWKLGSRIMQDINRLPPLLITPLTSLPVIGVFRTILCDALSAHQTTPRVGPVFLPACEQFLQLADNPFLLKSISYFWEQTLKDMKTADKKSVRKLSQRFLNCVGVIWAATSNVKFAQMNNEVGDDSSDS